MPYSNQEQQLEYRRKYYETHKAEILSKSKAWKEAHKEHLREYEKNRPNLPSRREYYRWYGRKHSAEAVRRVAVWTAENRDKSRENHNRSLRKSRIDHPEVWLARSAVSRMIRRAASGKGLSTWEYIGCDSVTLRRHLEDKWSGEMSWDNYGKLWHVDHIVPLSWFDLSVDEEKRKACHYSNLQPMIAKENLSKGNKWAG